MKYPNLFIIGAPKCGTTALVDQLSMHSAIFVPAMKEPRYFDARTFFDNENDWPIKTLNNYLSLYASTESQEAKYRLDGSVFNMYSESSILDILKLEPESKFIVIVRDPLEAAKSMHSQRLKYNETRLREVSEDFYTCWDLIEDRKNGHGLPHGCCNSFLFRYDLLYKYELYLPMLFRLISNKHLLVLGYAKFKSDPLSVHKKVINFLNIPHQELHTKQLNQTYVIKPTYSGKMLAYFIRKTIWLRKKVKISPKLKNGLTIKLMMNISQLYYAIMKKTNRYGVHLQKHMH